MTEEKTGIFCAVDPAVKDSDKSAIIFYVNRRGKVELKTWESIEHCEAMQKFAQYVRHNYPLKAMRILSPLETKCLESECNMILRFIDNMKKTPAKLNWWKRLILFIRKRI